MKIEIKHRWTNACLWSGEIEDQGSDQANLGTAVKAALAGGANLAGANLAGANLAGANLAGANLVDANLAGANLAGANLVDANLADAYLAGANLADAYLVGANLAGANLVDANLADANLEGANLAGANLPDGFRVARLDFGGWPILVMPEWTRIGCQKHPNSEWLKWEPEDAEIRAMATGARDFWRLHKDSIRAVIRDVMVATA